MTKGCGKKIAQGSADRCLAIKGRRHPDRAKRLVQVFRSVIPIEVNILNLARSGEAGRRGLG